MSTRDTDAAPLTPSWLDAETHRKARHVAAGHSQNAEECAHFLAVLGIDNLPSDEIEDEDDDLEDELPPPFSANSDYVKRRS